MVKTGAAAETPLNLEKNSMSDNIRNKAIFEIKIAKIAQNLPKIDILLNLTLMLHNGNVFAHTTKNSGVSIFYSYRDLAWTKHKFKKWLFWPKLPKFLAKLNFDFLNLTLSSYIIYGNFFNFFPRKLLRDMVALHTDRWTDGRTYTEGRTIYVSHRGRHIITNHK